MANPIQPPGTSQVPDRREARHASHAQSTYKQFLKDLQQRARLGDEEAAQRAAVTVVGMLEQRIFGEEAEDLEAQLPSILRELLQQRPRHAGKPQDKFGRAELFARVARELGLEESQVEPLVRAVFATVRAHISEGEAENIGGQLPKELAALWMLPA